MSVATIQARVAAELREELQEILDFLISEIREELSAQGHKLTGQLSQSLTRKVFDRAGQIIAEVEMLKYGAYQDQGIKPSRIPFGRSTSGAPGRARSQFIEGLQRWVKLRGIATEDKLALRIAFAIAKKMKAEGMPTARATRFSRNGRRTGFLTQPWRDNRREVEAKLDDAAERYLDKLLSDLLFETSQEFENLMLL